MDDAVDEREHAGAAVDPVELLRASALHQVQRRQPLVEHALVQLARRLVQLARRVVLRARLVALRARRVVLRARLVVLLARPVVLRARLVVLLARLVALLARRVVAGVDHLAGGATGRGRGLLVGCLPGAWYGGACTPSAARGHGVAEVGQRRRRLIS